MGSLQGEKAQNQVKGEILEPEKNPVVSAHRHSLKRKGFGDAVESELESLLIRRPLEVRKGSLCSREKREQEGTVRTVGVNLYQDNCLMPELCVVSLVLYCQLGSIFQETLDTDLLLIPLTLTLPFKGSCLKIM